MDILMVRGLPSDVEQVTSVIRSLDQQAAEDVKAAPGPEAVDRINDLLFDKGYRLVVQDGKLRVVRLAVEFDFRCKPWGQVLETLAAQLHLFLKAPKLPPVRSTSATAGTVDRSRPFSSCTTSWE